MSDDAARVRSGFDEVLSRVARRAGDAALAKGRARSDALRADLARRLAGSPGSKDGFVADPVLEAARVWKRADASLDDLAGDMLEEDLVAALDCRHRPDGRRNDRRWPRRGRDVEPYLHQFQAWEAARAERSFMVTSGTGSGKTECFAIPMLDDLLRAHRPGEGGVRALVIYPLNALIDSQRERLSAWMDPLSDRLSYAVYNGNTPRSLPARERRVGAELRDRKAIRETPPSLMVTNVTMLEYMLARADDQPILAKSQGRLRWIVLDEAHSYVGAQAAEMALLLRRVRSAFGVAPADVRLAATSATIGEGETDKLKRFLADLAGLKPHQVEVIGGTEDVPDLPPEGPDGPIDGEALPMAPEALWEMLAPNPRVRAVRAAMRGDGIGLLQAAARLGCAGPEEALAIMEGAARAHAPGGLALAPWRLHAFHRAQGGLWACVDPNCPERGPDLRADGSDWPHGQVHLTLRERCGCGAPVLEIGACDECGTPWMMGEVAHDAQTRVLRGCLSGEAEDDYLLDLEPDRDGDDDAPAPAAETVLLAPAGADAPDRLRLSDGALFERPPEGERTVPVRLVEPHARGCCERANRKRVTVRPQRFGAPFLMGAAMPLLLEGAKSHEHGAGDGPMPFAGRRLLSFTDSRQGTARFSAKLQQDAERTLTRAVIHHAMQERGGDPALAAELRVTVEGLRGVVEAMPALRGTLEEKEAQLREAEGGARARPWPDMIDLLARNEDLRQFATDVWRGRPGIEPKAFDRGPSKLAELFLYRETFRRPRLQNNVETMGIARLRFPGLVRSATLKVPAALREAGHGVQIWDDLLHAAVDVVFRAQLAIELPESPLDVRHWISPRGAVSAVIEPGADPEETGSVRKPTRFPDEKVLRSGLVLLVHALIGVVPGDPAGPTAVRDVLAAIWTTLRQQKVIVSAGPAAWRLDLASAEIAPVETAHECMVTGRLLPYAPGGWSLNAIPEGARTRPVAMPVLPLAAPQGPTKAERTDLRRWLASDTRVTALRRAGHWSDLHDRTAEFAPFLRAQEHSAQIDRASLKVYEDAFAAGRINVLNCSTTMEMGVDIPDVGLVVNTNVPPSPANYRQRVGRAGRRGEPWALAFTFCKDLPLDAMIFRDPARLLRAQVAAPAVRLDSGVLVQRHINAALLGTWLRDERGGIAIKMSIGAFLGATPNPEDPWALGDAAGAFLAAMRDEWGSSDAVSRDIATLVTGTCLEGRSGLVERAGEAFALLRKRWRDEYEALLNAQAAHPKGEAAHGLYEKRAQRMRDEFMLTEFARRGFTPSYGFPVDVVSFEHAGGTGERARPSRQLEVAIREYSPGCEVVIDGLVHRSEGVMPVWGNRMDASSVEDLRATWECKQCGLWGTGRADAPACPHCEGPVRRGEMLRPAGFVGDRTPHSAYEQLAYVPPDPPRVSAGTEPWVALPDAGVGRHRTAREGRVLMTSSGEAGEGYAICIACGRAASEETSDGAALPANLANHFPLRRQEGSGRHDGRCSGNDPATRRIRRRVRLGTEFVTDVFELQLDGAPNTKDGRAIAGAVGAALREALAARLGVDAEEMGLAVAAGLRADGDRRSDAFLFDRASGGSGFASTAGRELGALLREAADRLDCPAACIHGCPECILRRDLQFGDRMDREGARALLVEEVLPRLALPEAAAVMGPGTWAVTRPLQDWAARRIDREEIEDLTLFMHDGPGDWDMTDWPGLRLAERVAKAGRQVRVAIRTADLSRLEMSHKLDLLRLLERGRASLHAVPEMPAAAGAPILAEMTMSTGTTAFATQDPEAAGVNRGWGRVEAAPLLCGPHAATDLSPALSTDRLARLGEGTSARFDVSAELDGAVSGFGGRFWRTVRRLRPQAFGDGRHVTQVTYGDRYLRAPLPARLLWEVWRTMPGRGEGTALRIVSERMEREGWTGRHVFDNWSDDATRRAVLGGMFEGADIRLGGRADCAHARSLAMTFEGGAKMTILLDQGFGAWEAHGRPRLDHEAPAKRQAHDVIRSRFDVSLRGGGRQTSPLVVSW